MISSSPRRFEPDLRLPPPVRGGVVLPALGRGLVAPGPAAHQHQVPLRRHHSGHGRGQPPEVPVELKVAALAADPAVGVGVAVVGDLEDLDLLGVGDAGAEVEGGEVWNG